MVFIIDERIQSTGFTLAEWPLSRVFLKNEQTYPWVILVPRKNNVQEIHQLDKADQHVLMEEINQLSLIMRDYFNPSKLNIGALGNVVPQLHVHVVARQQDDPLWPQGVWQSSFEPTPYTKQQADELIQHLQPRVVSAFMQDVNGYRLFGEPC